MSSFSGEAGRQALLDLKASAPQLFPEYRELLEAKAALSVAQQRVRQARDAWEKLGEA